ncbi:hypothetical protein A2707_03020 [Candidatus Saccharibacteria bacterium RIFCSPHIGHO2_01_FULL_45_15]|nr:MAG: hypothetical protein A2707_03020 [Candidatus Saccharibacteria bacterium RIFCSPHIGHO2_01_FULL_45_15]OGL27082.1 MAG: hypothetical protein A3C39_00870 [Candidatus Saccharibacteria bacterium RIFCSPHIGHO2_02_FULL_46_12]OGL32526.1 MAG: hypothetical protein A3E76_00550 [Candidatus Saccharibacteria bacterium RIFCSPHIGHO2_12_FULL_44_22]
MEISAASLTTPISHFFSKYHPTIFLVSIGLLLAVAVFLLTLTLQEPTAVDETAAIETISSSFDEDTIKKIEALRDSSETPQSITFPSPRNSPFVE